MALPEGPMTTIRFDYCTVTISDRMIQAPSPTLTALLDTLAATLPGYGSLRFEMDADLNIARDLIEKIGARKIVRRERCRPVLIELVGAVAADSQ